MRFALEVSSSQAASSVGVLYVVFKFYRFFSTLYGRRSARRQSIVAIGRYWRGVVCTYDNTERAPYQSEVSHRIVFAFSFVFFSRKNTRVIVVPSPRPTGARGRASAIVFGLVKILRTAAVGPDAHKTTRGWASRSGAADFKERRAWHIHGEGKNMGSVLVICGLVPEYE